MATKKTTETRIATLDMNNLILSAKRLETIKVYYADYRAMADLTLEEQGMMFTYLCKYAFMSQRPRGLPKHLKVLFDYMAAGIDREIKRYNDKLAKKEQAKLRREE